MVESLDPLDGSGHSRRFARNVGSRGSTGLISSPRNDLHSDGHFARSPRATSHSGMSPRNTEITSYDYRAEIDGNRRPTSPYNRGEERSPRSNSFDIPHAQLSNSEPQHAKHVHYAKIEELRTDPVGINESVVTYSDGSVLESRNQASYDSDRDRNETDRPPSRKPQNSTTKSRPKSSSLWEKIKRREQRNQQLMERGFFEHAPPDFIDMTNEPNFCGDREEYVLDAYPKKKTLYYSKKGGDASYIDVVAEVQTRNGELVNIEQYDEPEDANPTLSLKHGKALRARRPASGTPHYPYDDSMNYSGVKNAKELRQVVYDDWLARKAIETRAEQKKKTAWKREETRLQEEDFKNKVMASKAAFLMWKKEKSEVLKKKKDAEKEKIEKEAEKNRKKKEDTEETKHHVEAWVKERAAKAEKQAIERRRILKEEKQKQIEEKQQKEKLCQSAYDKWEKQKVELAKKQYLETKKETKAKKVAAFKERLDRDEMAVDSYKKWLEEKEKRKTDDSKMRRATSSHSMGRLSSRSDFINERPAWFPASRTVPRRSVRL